MFTAINEICWSIFSMLSGNKSYGGENNDIRNKFMPLYDLIDLNLSDFVLEHAKL